MARRLSYRDERALSGGHAMVGTLCRMSLLPSALVTKADGPFGGANPLPELMQQRGDSASQSGSFLSKTPAFLRQFYAKNGAEMLGMCQKN